MIVYRGISADGDFDVQITAKGTEVEAEIMAGNDDVYVGNESLTIYPSKSNGANLQNVCSDKYKTGWLSCTSNYETACEFATAKNLQEGIVLTISIPDDIYHQITYSEHNHYAIEDNENEILINMTKLKNYKIPKDWIINQEVIEVK